MSKDLQNYYKNKELNKLQLETLQAIQTPSFWNFQKISALATLIIVAFAGFQFNFSTNLKQEVLGHVLKNHLKNMPVEVLSSSTSTINEALDKLDFDVYLSEDIKKQYTVLGARYCTVQKKIAAQLKLEHKISKIRFTLFQYKPTNIKQLRILEKENLTKNDSVAKLWLEKDVAFVLAGPQNK